MSKVEVTVPSVGESITEATVGGWNFGSGDWVEKDAVLFELETEKATMEVTAPAEGLLEIKEESGNTVGIGAVVALIDSSAEKPAGGAKAPTPKKAASSSSAKPTSKPIATASVSEEELRGLGPAARKEVREGKRKPPSAQVAGPGVPPLAEGEERKPMSTIRKKIAERLKFSQQSTATLTTFQEVDMSQIMATRGKLKDQFQNKFGVKLGFMSFFTKAIVYAASEVPIVNARLDGGDIVYNKHVHAGVAVSTDRGLVVPVVRFADRLSYADIEKSIGALAEKARDGKLGIDEMMGGTFTVTNGGTFGSLLSTPILNPPQSAILGMHKTEMRPVAVKNEKGTFDVEVRPMMYLAMSYDHRLIDGRDSVTFLVKVKEYLESVNDDMVMKG